MSIILCALERLLNVTTQATIGTNEQDGKGLTGYEVRGARGAIAKGDERWAARILRRYVNTQLTAEEADAVRGQPVDPEVRISRSCEVTLGSRISGQRFESYKTLLKETLRGRYNPQTYGWQIKAEQVEEAVAWFQEHGFLVLESPVFSSEELAQASEQQAKLDKTVTVRFAEGKIRFKSARRSDVFNLIFNNKSGKLSGVTEYLEDTYERATMSFALAHEAMAKLQEAGFILSVDSSFEQANAEHLLQEAAFEIQDPEVTAKLNPVYKLFHHQNKAVEFIENAEGRCIVGACMGSGKTLMTLAWAAKRGLRVCVVCPKVVRRTWVQEAGKFFPEHFAVCAELDRKKKMPEAKEFDLISVNYESVTKWEAFIRDGAFDLLIVDESHYIKNFKAQRTQVLLALAQAFRHRMLLSGTVVKNDRYELHPQLQMLDHEHYGDNCTLFRQTTGKFWHDIQNVYLAMPKSEVLAFLPSKTTVRFDNEVEEPVGLPGSIEEITQYKHDCARSKTDITIEKIQDILDNSDDSVLVFSEFKDVCREIEKHFGALAIYHDGEMSHEARERAKGLFQEDDCEARIFVSTRPSLAVGATLTKASHVVFNDLPWNAADIQQAEDRTHRIGQHKPITVHWVVAENSDFDSRLIELIDQKYRIQKAVTEGKQLTPAEQEFLRKPITFADLIRAENAKERKAC